MSRGAVAAATINVLPAPRGATSTSLLIIDVMNVIAGFAVVRAGAADRLWRAVESQTPWRNGPAWQATFLYFCLLAGGWAVLNVVLFAAALRAVPLERIALRAGRFIVAACAVVIIQVLVPPVWPLVACAAAVPAVVLSDPSRRARRRWLAWWWPALGIGLASLLVDRYFVGIPTFVPRLALCLTAWRLLGAIRPLRLERGGEWTPDWLP